MFENGEFSITVGKLSKIMSKLPPNAVIIVNDVKQLNIYLNDDWLGTIEFGQEAFTIWDSCLKAWNKWKKNGENRS